jgi:hypothetical protein
MTYDPNTPAWSSPQPIEPPTSGGKQAFTRVCSKCSTQATTTEDHCPNCGASYMRQRGLSKRGKIALAASVIALLIIAGVVALLARHSSDQHAAKVAAAKSRAAASSSAAAVARSEAAAAAASSSAEAASESAAADTLERERRKLIVEDMQASMTKDARKDVSDGVLDGPIKKTECTPVGGGSNDLLEDTTGQFSCIAVNKISSDGTESGYQFTAVVNWTTTQYSWHLGN